MLTKDFLYMQLPAAKHRGAGLVKHYEVMTAGRRSDADSKDDARHY